MNTRAILRASEGRVLIIDEAHKLYADTVWDPSRTAVIDTIVDQVQSTSGEDLCVLLLGYKEQMAEVLENSNQDLARRFPLSSAFQFDDLNDNELREILEHKLKKQGLEATEEAKNLAIEVLATARDDPNFGNADEVEHLISRAKEREQIRRRSIEDSRKSPDIVFLPQDFDACSGPAADTSSKVNLTIKEDKLSVESELCAGKRQAATESVPSSADVDEQSVESEPHAGKQQAELVVNSADVATPASPSNVSFVTVTECKPSVELEPPAREVLVAVDAKPVSLDVSLESPVTVAEDKQLVEPDIPVRKQQAELVSSSADVATPTSTGNVSLESPLAVTEDKQSVESEQQPADPITTEPVINSSDVETYVNHESLVAIIKDKQLAEFTEEPPAGKHQQAEAIAGEPVANSADITILAAPSNFNLESPVAITEEKKSMEFIAEPKQQQVEAIVNVANPADVPESPVTITEDRQSMESTAEPKQQQVEAIVNVTNSADVLESPVTITEDKFAAEPPGKQQAEAVADEPAAKSADVATPAAPVAENKQPMESTLETPGDQQAEPVPSEPVPNSEDVATPAQLPVNV